MNPLAKNGRNFSLGRQWYEFKRDVVENAKDAYTNCGGGPKRRLAMS